MSLPIAANAQSNPATRSRRATLAVATAGTSSARPPSLAAAVRLTRRGVHSTVAHTFVSGLEIVDQRRVDVDADGDLDVLALLDLAESREPKPGLGRGVAVIYRERRGWRGRTVASVPRLPAEAGYNWGRSEVLRLGAAPLLHVMFSRAGANGSRQADTVIQHERGTLREVYASSVESVAGTRREGATVRALEVRAADIDGDGTSELLERVATSAQCPASTGCVTPDGMVAPSVTRRVLRWDELSRMFSASTGVEPHHDAATRALEAAHNQGRAGDTAARDAAVARAFALDPLDPDVRMAFAELQIRQRAFTAAMDTLEFAWPEGFGREARSLQAEAAARGRNVRCGHYLALLRSDDPARGAALVRQLGPLATPCRSVASTLLPATATH